MLLFQLNLSGAGAVSIEPVTLDMAKRQCRLEGTTADELMTAGGYAQLTR